MKNLEQKAIEGYFDEEVTKMKNGEFFINGHWYQVRPTSFMNTEDPNGEFSWVLDCPTYEYNGIEYFIIEQ